MIYYGIKNNGGSKMGILEYGINYQYVSNEIPTDDTFYTEAKGVREATENFFKHLDGKERVTGSNIMLLAFKFVEEK